MSKTTQIRELLKKHFDSSADLEELCQDLDLDTHKMRRDTVAEFILDITVEARRRNKLDEISSWMQGRGVQPQTAGVTLQDYTSPDPEQALRDTLQILEEAEKSATEDKVLIAQLHRKAGRLYRDQGNFDIAMEYYELGLDVLGAEASGIKRDIEEAQLLTERAAIYIEKNRYQAALQDAEHAQKLLRHKDAKFALGHALQTLAVIYRNLNERPKFLKLMHKARDAYMRTGDIQAELRVLGNLAIDALHWGNYEEAIKLFQEALDKSATEPNSALVANVYLNLAIAYTDAEQLDQAVDYAEKSLIEHSDRKDRIGQLMSYSALTEALKEQVLLSIQTGNIGTARNLVQQTRRLVNEGLGLVDLEELGREEVADSILDLHRIMAEAYMAISELAESEEHFEQVATLENEQNIGSEILAKGWYARAKLAEVKQEYRAAIQLLEQARETFVNQEYWKDVLPVDIMRARILEQIGESSKAREILENALDEAEMRSREKDRSRIVSALKQRGSRASTQR